eukprot:TRINITY_DN688_c0_g1_i4.p1 TRINITY_DN688_c0_g1~~TRINITY_DN688_c0_g1_i4.p1  ORF type:complete len:240 (-),score=25.26 TRINITY_DN688_c0_g1_i4:949-1668(-)
MLSCSQQKSTVGFAPLEVVQQSRRNLKTNVLPLLYEDTAVVLQEVQQEVVHLAMEQVSQAGLQVSGLSAGYCFTQFGISPNEIMAPDLVDKDSVEDMGACLLSATYEFPFEEEELSPEVYQVLNQRSANQVQYVQQRLSQELGYVDNQHSTSGQRRRRQSSSTARRVSDILGGQEVLNNLIRSSSNLEMVTMFKDIFWYCIDNCTKHNTFSIDECDINDSCHLHEGLAASFSSEIAAIC